MKVLWLSHLVPYPPNTGVELRAYNLLRELSRYHQVRVIGFNQPALVPAAKLAASIEVLRGFCEVGDIYPIPVSRGRWANLGIAASSLLRPLPYTVNWAADARLQRSFERELVQFAPDLVHHDTLALAPYRDPSRPVVRTLTHHNIESDMLSRRVDNEPNPLKRAYFAQEAVRVKRYERRVAGDFAAHLVCSSVDRERLLADSPTANVQVIPNGVDVDFFKPTSEDLRAGSSTIIFAGAMSWYPNISAIRYLVDKVWPLVAAQSVSARLKIVGRAPPDWLRERARADDRIEVTGFVEDVRPHLQAAAVYACPIFDGGGTKLKVLDALAMGVPLVAHPIACEGIEVRDDVDVLLARDPAEFAARILRLLDDRALQQRLSVAGRALIESKYAFRAIGLAMSALYEQLRERPQVLRNTSQGPHKPSQVLHDATGDR